jgi:uncharacterized membrane protein
LAAGGGALAFAGAKASTTPGEQIARSSVIVNTTPESIYQFWRNFENLPLFMHHLHSVTVLDDRRSRWVAQGPLGSRIHWEAEIVDEKANELIAWQSLPDSDVRVDGMVEFRSAPGKRGTLIDATISYQTRAGKVGAKIAKMLGKDPNWLMRQDLRRLKALLEAGEIPTVEGQSHGPRSTVAAVARVIDPDRPITRESNLGEVLSTRRRAS